MSLLAPIRLLAGITVLVASASVAWDSVSPADAIHHLGDHATVCGRVANAKYAADSRGSPTFLNLDRSHPDHVFTVVIWGTSRPNFPYRPETLTGKLLCVTGTITSYRGKAQIEATDASQLEIQHKPK